MNSCRFLFFLYHFPPLPGIAPKRNDLISSEISNKVSYAHVFTSAKQDGKLSDFNGVVETVNTIDYRSLFRAKSAHGAFPEKSKKSLLKQGVIKLMNTFPFNLIIGEGGIYYYFSLLRHGKRIITENNITHIYSSYRPFADHYAAYRLKRKFPHIIWIADFRDLIVDPHYRHIFFSERQQKKFQKIFSTADLLTTVSDGLCHKLKAYNNNAITLRNGIKNIPAELKEVHCKYFRLVYTGSMFLDKRNAEPVFMALHQLDQDGLINLLEVRIYYAGKDGAIWEELAEKYSMESILVNKGVVPPEEAAQIQQDACINLLLTVSSDELQGVFTGKMTDYFKAGSPVLGIIVNQNDPEISELLAELEIGKSFSDRKHDLTHIKEFIFREYLYWKRNGTNRKPVNLEVLRKKYDVKETMKILWEQLKCT